MEGQVIRLKILSEEIPNEENWHEELIIVIIVRYVLLKERD